MARFDHYVISKSAKNELDCVCVSVCFMRFFFFCTYADDNLIVEASAYAICPCFYIFYQCAVDIVINYQCHAQR